ncbi:hypothetical protein BBBOND_0403880 [Babesia bigemina]|uniref:Uncharacterized protein n=1 Tax=Babesia bigemina TaxID=5866 RepID=A0A061DEU7_BABBI|nr:hypothetical protein BBBOND_0403880 [Babesia bigemina]CDR97900.1 hypothetical protein BBBOND_0403880 [Babesia bigemina]|eukprot:XP_012770086.1 hypothetical protein BBBOND_0403880 [Babesia bigemina]
MCPLSASLYVGAVGDKLNAVQLESRTTNSFLEAKVGEDNPTTEDVGDDSDQLEPAEAAPKTWDLQAALGDGESLLYESVCLGAAKGKCLQKACSLSRYNDTEWSTPMPVVLQIIAKEESDEKRIVCYQAGTGRIQLNTTVLPTMSVNKLKTKSIIFVGQLIGRDAHINCIAAQVMNPSLRLTGSSSKTNYREMIVTSYFNL